ncbi:MAG: ABC transporter permease [Pirellulales bacterium]
MFAKIARKDQPSNFFLSSEIDGLRTFAAIMPTIFLGVAALVLNVLMSRLTEQQRTVIDTLKALGYGHGAVLAHFLKFGLLVGLLGGVVGCGLGYLLAEGMTALYGQFYRFPALPNRSYPDIYAAGIAISLVCAVAGSVHGVRLVLRLQPAEAMRPKPPPSGGAVWLERCGVLWQRLNFGWRLVLRAIIRQRLRTSVGVIAAALGAALLSAGLMMVDSSLFMVEYEFKQLSRSDVDLTFESERGRDALLEVERLPGVDLAEPTLNVACTMSNGPLSRDVGIMGVAANARLTLPRDAQHRPVAVPENGLMLTRALADRLRLRVGDTVTVQPIKGLQREHTVPVTAISDGYIGMAAYADIEYLSRLVCEEYALTGAQLALDRNAEARRRLDRALKEMPAIQAVNDRAALLQNLRETFLQNLWIFQVELIVFAGVIFFGSIVNASLVSLSERGREVATLRAIGYGPWEIGSLFFKESAVVSALGTLLGLPLGYVLMLLLARTYDTEMFRMPVVVHPAALLQTVVTAGVFIVAAHLFVQRKIMQLDWLEALKAQE